MAFFTKRPAAPKPSSPAAPPASPQAAAPAASATPSSTPPKPPGADNALAANQTIAPAALLSLGEIVSLMMRSQNFQQMPLGAISALLTPAVSGGQFLVARAQTKEGAVAPVAACLWARVSPEVDARLSQDLEKPIRLSPADWKSGDIVWGIVFVGDQRGLIPLLQQLQKETLGGKPIKMRIRGDDGIPKVQVV